MRNFFITIFILVFTLGLTSCSSGKLFPSRNPASEIISLAPNISITRDQLDQFIALSPRTEKDYVLYHWTSYANMIRWSTEGHISEGELNFLNQPSGSLQVHGPGLYVSLSPTNSKQFGDGAIQIQVPKGTLKYDPDLAKKIFGQSLDDKASAVLCSKYPMLRDLKTLDWYVINHPSFLNKVQYAGVSDVHFRENEFVNNRLSNTLHFYHEFWNGIRTNSEGHYLESLLALTQYVDGVSFVRALNVDPANPWQEFEPENFEKYRKNYQEIIFKSLKRRNSAPYDEASIVAEFKDTEADMGITDLNGHFGSPGKTAREWANDQVDRVLPQIYKDDSEFIRTEGVLAGGSEKDNTFLVSAFELVNLKSNPFLEVVVKQATDDEHFYVNYSYPDVFHFKKLKGRISDGLYSELLKHNEQELFNNHALRRKLNSQLVRELLVDTFVKYHGKEVDYHKGISPNLYKDLMSIHPHDNFNGRSLRLYLTAAHFQENLEPFYHFSSDYDLLQSPFLYSEIGAEATGRFYKMRSAFLSELLLKAKEGNPDYVHLKEVNEMFLALRSLGLNTVPELSEEHWDLIKERKFYHLNDLMLGEKWKKRDFGVLYSAFKKATSEKEKREFISRFLAQNVETKDLWGFLERGTTEGFDPEFLNFLFEQAEGESKNKVSLYLPFIIGKSAPNLKALKEASLEMLNYSFEALKNEDTLPKMSIRSFIERILGGGRFANTQLVKNIANSQMPYVKMAYISYSLAALKKRPTLEDLKILVQFSENKLIKEDALSSFRSMMRYFPKEEVQSLAEHMIAMDANLEAILEMCHYLDTQTQDLSNINILKTIILKVINSDYVHDGAAKKKILFLLQNMQYYNDVSKKINFANAVFPEIVSSGKLEEMFIASQDDSERKIILDVVYQTNPRALISFFPSMQNLIVKKYRFATEIEGQKFIEHLLESMDYLEEKDQALLCKLLQIYDQDFADKNLTILSHSKLKSISTLAQGLLSHAPKQDTSCVGLVNNFI